MSSMNLVKRIPPMMMGEELEKALQIMPDYDESIRDESEAVRLMALSDLRNIFIPPHFYILGSEKALLNGDIVFTKLNSLSLFTRF